MMCMEVPSLSSITNCNYKFYAICQLLFYIKPFPRQKQILHTQANPLNIYSLYNLLYTVYWETSRVVSMSATGTSDNTANE